MTVWEFSAFVDMSTCHFRDHQASMWSIPQGASRVPDPQNSLFQFVLRHFFRTHFFFVLGCFFPTKKIKSKSFFEENYDP